MRNEKSSARFRTRAIHDGQATDPQTGAIIPPVYFASTFVQSGPGEYGEFDYSRSGNPTRKAFETTIASLEGGFGGLAFASGMAATHCAMSLLKTGEHVLAGQDIYGGTYRLLHKVIDRVGIKASLVDTTDPSQIKASINPQTRLLWLESPGNPLMSITDLKACAAIGHEHGLIVAVDNTLASPVLTRPLELGADLVMHSATKYIGGHSDVMGGVLVTKTKELWDQLYFVQNATGGIMGPLESFLCSRGLKTMDLRVREQARTAMLLATFLKTLPPVTRVLYPGLVEHRGHSIASRQMEGGFGAMLSFEVAGGSDAAKKVVTSTRLFRLAVSLGAVESLIEQPSLMSHSSYDPQARLAHGITDGLIRLSVGLEDPQDLQEDLRQAITDAA